MIKRTVGSGLLLVAVAGGIAGCSSSAHKASTTTARPIKATSTTASSSTTAPVTSTTAAATTTSVAPAPPTTAAPASPPRDPQTAAKQFFAAWLAHSNAGLHVNGTTTAASQAIAQYNRTAGATWVFSNCQGAAGSEYCTWVRAAEAAIVRASSVSPANRTVEFQWRSLDAPAIAEQFVNAWQFHNAAALGILGTSQAANQAQALYSASGDGWQAPSSCDGTAGSFYCTFTAGAKQAVVRVGDVGIPRQVLSLVVYT
jgi:hypothetical protein